MKYFGVLFSYPFLSVDKKYLPEDNQVKTHSLKKFNKKIWLWHLPFGVTESDIKEHYLQKGFWKSDMTLNKLHDYEKKFIGYEIDFPEGFNLTKYVNEKNLPSGKKYEHEQPLFLTNFFFLKVTGTNLSLPKQASRRHNFKTVFNGSDTIRVLVTYRRPKGKLMDTDTM